RAIARAGGAGEGPGDAGGGLRHADEAGGAVREDRDAVAAVGEERPPRVLLLDLLRGWGDGGQRLGGDDAADVPEVLRAAGVGGGRDGHAQGGRGGDQGRDDPRQ